jgi:hypothetical protein
MHVASIVSHARSTKSSYPTKSSRPDAEQPMLVAAAARAALVVRTPLLQTLPNIGEDVGDAKADAAAGVAGLASPNADEGES